MNFCLLLEKGRVYHIRMIDGGKLNFLFGDVMLEKFVLYQKYVDFMHYTYLILVKYPKVERFSLSMDMKNILNNGLLKVIYFQKYRDKTYLDELDVYLKTFMTYVRISYKRKYINLNNYRAFSKKYTSLENIRRGLYE